MWRNKNKKNTLYIKKPELKLGFFSLSISP